MLGSVLLQAAGTAHESFLQFLGENLELFLTYTGVYNATPGHLIMILVGLLFIFLAIKYEFEPMLLIPIGFGILIGNIPFKDAGLQVGIYEQGSVLNILYQGVTSGWYPPLIFLGIGAMTDFSALISNPKLMLIGAAAQFGIFGAYIIALQMGFEPNQAGAIGIIGGADGPTAIFFQVSSELDGCYCSIGILLYGAGSYYPASVHAPADDSERTSDPYETAESRFFHGKDRIPDRRPVADLLPSSFRSASVGYAVLRKFVERKWCNTSFG